MMFSPNDVLIVAVEDDPSGMLRVYFSANGDGHPYILIENEEDKERARHAWDASATGHLFMKRPPADGIFEDAP